MKFRLLNGSHTVTHKKPDASGKLRITGRTVFKATSSELPVIESAVDLCEKFNHPMSKKFERVPDDTVCTKTVEVGLNTQSNAQGPNPADEILSMSLKQLQRYAQENDIDIGNAQRKEDLIRIITEALVPA